MNVVVDTNVAVVANGRSPLYSSGDVSTPEPNLEIDHIDTFRECNGL